MSDPARSVPAMPGNNSEPDYQVAGELPEEGHISSLIQLAPEGAMRLQEILEAAPGPTPELTKLLQEG